MTPKSFNSQIIILTFLATSIFSFSFKLEGEENRKCMRFRNDKTGKAYRVVEFYYQSNQKKKGLQVQIHEELFSLDKYGESIF